MQGLREVGTQDFRDVGVRGVPTHLLIHHTPLPRCSHPQAGTHQLLPSLPAPWLSVGSCRHWGS